MTYKPVKTEDGVEVQDKSGETIEKFNTWPPRDGDKVEALFDHVQIPNDQKDLFMILFGIAELGEDQ